MNKKFAYRYWCEINGNSNRDAFFSETRVETLYSESGSIYEMDGSRRSVSIESIYSAYAECRECERY